LIFKLPLGNKQKFTNFAIASKAFKDSRKMDLGALVEGMYKEYIQTTYTSQIDKNIIRTENKMKTNYAKKNFYPTLFTLLYFIILCVATSF
jgi:hypothetical protein